MAVDDVFKLVVNTTHQSSLYQNTYAFRVLKEPAVTLAEVTALANDFKEAFRAMQSVNLVYRTYKFYQVYGAGVTYDPVECKRSGGLVFEQSYSGSIAGTDATGDLPPQCAWVLTLYTNQIGRRKRGRVYLPGWTEGKQTAGNWGATDLTSMNTAIASLVNEYGPTHTDPTFQWGIFSEREAIGCEPAAAHPHPPVRVDPPHPELAFTPLDRVVARGIVYTQRRRVVGVGR
jgi:maltose-binding protein MalE